MDLKAIGRPASPAALPDTVGDRGLPLRHLVGMREELIRPRRTDLVVLPGQRLHQRTDVAHDRELLLDPQSLQLEQVRMQAKRRADPCRNDRQQAVTRDRQARCAPDCGVGIVVGGRCRNDHVVAVVPAGEEHTDQRPVLGPLREGVDHAEALHAGDECSGAEGIPEAGVPGLQQEFTARDLHRYFST